MSNPMFTEWLEEREGYSSRWERFLDDMVDRRNIKLCREWLEAAYNEGYNQCSSEVNEDSKLLNGILESIRTDP